MNNSPLVSVILPTYNRAEWLPTSIGSVLSQTYSNWELIVWDDGSSDGTEDLVRSFYDERIHYFKGSNKGASYARNCAIGKSTGEYIAFLDSDDQWLDNKLSRQVELLERYPFIDLLFGNYVNLDLAAGTKEMGFTQNKKSVDNLKSVLLEDSVFKIIGGMPESLFISNFIATDTVIVRKKVLEKEGFFVEDLRSSEDLEYWCRSALDEMVFAYLYEKTIVRNKPPGSLSSPSIIREHNFLKALDYCLKAGLVHGRNDLIPYINRSYQSSWQRLIRQYAIRGSRKKAIKAFIKSIRYGISWISCYLVAEAILGYKNTDRIKRLMKIGKQNDQLYFIGLSLILFKRYVW